MSIKLDDPDIRAAYDRFKRSDSDTDWLLLGYKGSRDRLSLYGSGSRGMDEAIATLIHNEVQYGLINVEAKVLLFQFIPEEGVSGVMRARALVHYRAVGSAFRHHASLTAAAPSDLNEATIRAKLRLDGQQSSAPPSPSPAQGANAFSSPSRFQGPYRPTGDFGPIQSNHQQSPLANSMSRLSVEDEQSSGIPPRTRRSVSPTPVASLSRPQSPSFSAPTSQTHTAPNSRPESLHQSQPQQTEPSSDHDAPVQVRLSSEETREIPRSSVRPTTSNNNALAQAMLAQSPSGDHLPLPEDADATPPRRQPSTASWEVISPEEARELKPRTSAVAPAQRETERAEAQKREQAERVQRDTERSQREKQEHAHRAQREVERAETQKHEQTQRVERERKEREAAERAREAVEAKARAQWEFERREREKLEYEQRVALEREERDRREAADRLRREELRRAEEKEKAEAELARKAEEERVRAAKQEEQKLLAARRLEEQLKAEEEARRRDEERRQAREQLQANFVAAKQSGDVMLQGHVSVQGGNSILWRRRWFQLRGDSLSLYKNEHDLTKPVDIVTLANTVRGLTEHPEEAAMPNSLKLSLRDDDSWLFYTDSAEAQELLVAALSMAAAL